MQPTAQAEKITVELLAVVSDERDALQGWTIQTEADKALAGEHLQEVKARLKNLETERRKITDPLHQAKKAVDDLFRKPKQALQALERELKQGIAHYLDAQRAKTEKALEQVAKAESEAEATEALAKVTHTTAPQGVSVRYKYRARVVDADKVPREFLGVDLRAVQSYSDAEVRHNGKPPEIPGIAFDREPIVTARAAS